MHFEVIIGEGFILTCTTGGGVGKRVGFSVKSLTLRVADMMRNLRGRPL